MADEVLIEYLHAELIAYAVKGGEKDEKVILAVLKVSV